MPKAPSRATIEAVLPLIRRAVESADAEGSVTGPPLAACAEIESCPTALGSSKQQQLATESAKLNRQEEQALAEEGMGSDREVWPPY